MLPFDSIIQLLENSNFYYVLTTNMAGNYSYINTHYAKSFAYISDSIVGMPYHITMHPDDTKVCEQVAAQCFTSPEKMFPATIRKHDGKGGYIITQWEYKAIINEKGEREGMFCLGYDITKFVDEQQQLKAAETEIEKKKNILQQIAFQHSHLIRSPLSNILGLADILNKTDTDQNVKNLCNMIVESANRLDDIIRDVVGKSYR